MLLHIASPLPRLREDVHRWAEVRPRLQLRVIVAALYRGLVSDGGALDAGGQLAYFTLLAFFPFCIVAFSLIAYLPLAGLDSQLLGFLSDVMPGDVARMCGDVLREVVGKQRGWLLALSLIGAVWTASGSVTSATVALNHAWDTPEDRPYWRTKGTALLLTAGGVATLIFVTMLLMLGTKAGDQIVERFAHATMPGVTHSSLRWVIVCGFMLSISSLAYYLLPNLHGEPHFVLPGALLATAAWSLVTFGFGFYVSRVGSYARLYGALGTAIVLLTWIYLAAVVLLVGGTLNATLDHLIEKERAS